MGEGKPSLRWSVEQKLQFIEFRLFWEGHVNRADLMDTFGVSLNQASGDLNRYIALDFGIVGTLTDSDKQYLAHNFIAFFRRDYKRVAINHVESGWVPPDTRIDELEAAIRACCCALPTRKRLPACWPVLPSR